MLPLEDYVEILIWWIVPVGKPGYTRLSIRASEEVGSDKVGVVRGCEEEVNLDAFDEDDVPDALVRSYSLSWLRKREDVSDVADWISVPDQVEVLDLSAHVVSIEGGYTVV